MPYPKDHKQRSRLRILDSAYRFFSRHGFDAVAIDDIMADAGMTRGAFYAHFTSKSELYQEALLHGIALSPMVQNKPSGKGTKSWLKKMLRGYLHEDHVRHSSSPCPLAFLATDVAVREPQVRRAYTLSFKGMNRMLTGYARSVSSCTDSRMLAITAMMIGGVAVARALDDAALTEDLLKSCRVEAERLLNGG